MRDLVSADILTSTPDDVCKSILKVLAHGSKDYAAIAQEADIRSHKTVDRHVKHLLGAKLVHDKKVKKGTRFFHSVSLIDKSQSKEGSE